MPRHDDELPVSAATYAPEGQETALTRRAAGTLIATAAVLLGRPGAAFAALAKAGGAGPAGRFGPARPFQPAQVVALAKALAAKPFVPRPVPANAAPTYDAHVKLTYDAAEQLPGHIRLFPARKDINAAGVKIDVISAGQARPLLNTRGLFGDGGAVDPAGFRVLFPDGHADWLAFLGGTYFRASGRLGQFGLSARGIAVNTGQVNTGGAGGEEFPDFTRFWIEAIGEDRLVIHALMDGPSLTGAFTIDTRRTPGGAVQDVTAALFLRRDIARLGYAAMSSMFVVGEDGEAQPLDWRPEVHDSDGLAIHAANGEQIWHPLANPSQPRSNAFHGASPKGFGLLQRDQTFDHYQDDNSFFDRRPSLWVEPKGDWGPGSVMVYAFPSVSENVDNTAAFYVTDAPARAGERRDYGYRLTWGSNVPAAGDNAICTAIRVGPGGVPGADPIPGATRYVFTFVGKVLTGLDRSSGVHAVTSLPAAAVILNSAGPINTEEGSWRVVLDVRTKGLAQDDFRIFLQRGGGALSETVIKGIRQ